MAIDYNIPFRVKIIETQNIPVSPVQVRVVVSTSRLSIPWECISFIEEFIPDNPDPFVEHQEDKVRLILNEGKQNIVVLDYSYDEMADEFERYKLWKSNQLSIFKKN